MEVFKKDFFELVEKAEHVVITAHLSPDDDSLGSVMALHEILVVKYPDKDIRIMYSAKPSIRHQSFARYKYIQFVPDIADHLEGVDLLVLLDVNNYARVSKKPEVLQGVPVRVAIDHHASPADVFTLQYIDTSYSSNAELVYALFKDTATLTQSLAASVLLGILGDTGGLAYVVPGKTQTFDLTKLLVETVGMSISAFRAPYGGIPKYIIPLLQELVKNTSYISVPGWPDMQYTYIVSPGEYSDEDMSTASHIYMGQYLPRIEGYEWGIVATPRSDGGTRVSARSLVGSVNVRDLFEKMQIGGGHDRASGAHIPNTNSEMAIQKVIEWMKNNKPMLG